VARKRPRRGSRAKLIVLTSIVTYMELVQGARSQVEVRGIRRTLQQAGIRMLPLTASIGGGAAALMAAHAGSSGLQIPYALIASTAREHDRVLVTGNVKHFRGIAGLEIEAFRR
jgi:predicted nucleic acid-binding protein